MTQQVITDFAQWIAIIALAVAVVFNTKTLRLDRKSHASRDAATFRAEMALAEKRTEATMWAKYGIAPKTVRQ